MSAIRNFPSQNCIAFFYNCCPQLLFFHTQQLQLLSKQMTQHRNDQIGNEIVNLLKDFYAVVLHRHKQMIEKRQVLDLFFKRIRPAPKNNVSVLTLKDKNQQDSQITTAEGEKCQINSRFPLHLAQNMLHTNLLSSVTNQSQLIQSRPDIKVDRSFSSSCVYKLLAFAFWMNFLEIGRIANSSNSSQHIAFSRQVARKGLAKIKGAMEKALRWLKYVDRRRHAKNGFLYRQLLEYTERRSDLKLEYISVIIEQFDSEYLGKTFEHLRQQEDELVYSKSILDDSSFSIDFSGLALVEEINKSLECLDAHLVVLEGSAEEGLDWEKRVNIVVDELPSGVFKLKDIITFRTSPSNSPIH